MKRRPHYPSSFCLTCTTTMSTPWHGWNCQGGRLLQKELVNLAHHHPLSAPLTSSFCVEICFAEDCQYSCPELQACVNASIWCDGKVHCPSGYDESFIHCSRILRLPAEALAVLCVLLIVLCCACSLYIRRFVNEMPHASLHYKLAFFFRKIRNHCQRSSVLQTRLKSLSSVNTNTDTAVFDEKDFISWQTDSVRYVEIDRVTTV